ncbi:MAG: hypothetical protein LVQ95_00265 [Candidatus Micrarchaeales archaeon]|nr:hypothetical protein [Candidatus Micrarchaeales archaeon]
MSETEDGLRNVPLVKIANVPLTSKRTERRFIVQHPQANQMIPQEIKTKYKELFDELESEGLDIALVMAVFPSALDAFAEAQTCYENERLDNRVAGACRDAIDNGVYEALNRKKTDLPYTFEIIKGEIKRVTWDEDFIKKVVKTGLLTEGEMNEMQSNVRDFGNFGTHLAERRDEELNPKKEYKWSKDHKTNISIKRNISHTEAYELLGYTKTYLILIFRRFFAASSESSSKMLQ